MAPDFIFMLTHSDRTIPDAQDRVPEALGAGVRHIGFKDIGLPFARLRRLADTIQSAGATLYLEVVSLGAESEEASARAAVELGVDVLMCGTRPHVVLPVLAGTGIRYYPFPGEIVGHPSALAGTTDAIVESACRLAAMEGVHGLDLLAYRFRAAVIQAGAAGFTVGTAALDGAFTARSTHLTDQLAFIVEQARPR